MLRITTDFSLRHRHARLGKRVAVVSLGGLGHMAVKYAHALGAHVTVLSQTRSTEDDGRRFGADVEVISADDVDSAYERVLRTDARYRFVIDVDTL